MIAYYLPMFVAVAGAMVCVMAVVATRAHLFQPMPASPFDLPASPDLSADTMVNQASVETVFADNGWKKATLSRLCDVEDLLDCLEASGVREREVETRGGSSFAVRWR